MLELNSRVRAGGAEVGRDVGIDNGEALVRCETRSEILTELIRILETRRAIADPVLEAERLRTQDEDFLGVVSAPSGEETVYERGN